MSGRSFLGTMVVAAALLAAASAAQAASWPYAIEVQVYEGPHDKTGQGWKSKTVALVPGSPEAQEWVDAHRRSNPGLVAAYERLTTTGPFTAHLVELLSLKGTRPKIHLVDDSRKYVDRDKDGKADTDAKAQEETGVWPHRRGGSIYISHSYFESYGEGAVEELLIHELSHTQDDTGRESGAYGPDGDHYADEILFDHGGGWKFWDRGHYSQRAAFLEGWANFTPLVFDPSLRPGVAASVESLRFEKEKGRYEEKSWKDASFQELAAVEHINSLILFDIYRFVPDGKQKIYEAFRATNHGGRTLLELLKWLVAHHPADAFAVAGIFDAYTGFKASDETLDELLGKELARVYRDRHRSGLRALNTTGDVKGAERAARAAAEPPARIDAAQTSLASLDRRIAELSGWRVDGWDLLGGPGSIVFRHWLRQSEKTKLEALRRAVAAELERLRAEEAARAVGRAAIMLPPPARELPGDAKPLSGEPPKPPGARPAGTVEGSPVEWGR